MITIFRNLFAPPKHLILLVIAAWIGLTLAEKRAERHGLSKDHLNNLIFYGIVAFIIGGRVSFVLQNIPTFTKSLLDIFSINPDLFDSFGALTITLIAMIIYGQRHNLALWPTLDALTPFFAIISVGLGLSHLAAGTAFGSPTKLPWAIDLWNAKRHPTQIYEVLASLLTFCLLWFKKPSLHPGLTFLSFTSLTAGWQLFIGGFRSSNILILNVLHQDQVAAWFVLMACFVLYEFRLKQEKQKSMY